MGTTLIKGDYHYITKLKSVQRKFVITQPSAFSGQLSALIVCPHARGEKDCARHAPILMGTGPKRLKKS
jgi:mRNA-degrading endonuclease toxin of MazEF toxin-antitoxin module